MIPSALVLAHAGAGATWQAMVVVAAVVLAAVVLAAGVGVLELRRPADLVGPVAAVVILASLGVVASEIISDWIGWGLPLAVVSSVTVLLGAVAGVDLRLPAPVPMGALALAGVSSWLLFAPLTVALHPPPEVLPLSDDASLTIVAPGEGESVPAGLVPITVAVTGGSIGPGGADPSALPTDPEEAGEVTVAVRAVGDDGRAAPQRRVGVEVVGCTVAVPCDATTLEVPLDPGEWQITVDLNRGDGTPLAPPVRARTTISATDEG